ncbi:MAG: tetratricopeptide repeat protein [Dehalococcoidia bacterium]|nr:tetratricopeptide repeat protein [Dehalococcoidia bacterium]
MTKALQRWQIPPLPRRLRAKAAKRRHGRELWSSLARRVRSRLSEATARQVKAELELCAADWLCETIRLNIKRGRLFELNRVLRESQADCFGYALLFHRISRRLGLKTGIVEVLIDNAGRMVPHMANVVSLSDRRTRFVDLWYGSKNIHHQRLALMIRQRGRWSVVDIDWRQLTSFAQVKGLPPRCIEAIEKYMMANRHLERGIRLSSKSELRRAVRLYTDAIARYPENARLYFNRAVAYENLGDKEAAQADYGAALHDEDSLIRVQARQHDEVVRLIGLDQIGASTREQEIYLLRKGFITGKEIPPERIAARYRLPVDGIDEIVSRVEARILSLPLTPVYP